jgi:hypothetical protein
MYGLAQEQVLVGVEAVDVHPGVPVLGFDRDDGR